MEEHVSWLKADRSVGPLTVAGPRRILTDFRLPLHVRASPPRWAPPSATRKKPLYGLPDGSSRSSGLEATEVLGIEPLEIVAQRLVRGA